MALFLSITALACGGKEPPPFKAGPAASYPAHQTNAKVTIGLDPITTDEKAKPAFGKNNPYKHGVLPVLVVIQNDTGKALRTDALKLEYLGPTGGRVAATPAAEVKYVTGPRRPNVMSGPTGAPKVLKRKNPLDTWEIEGRAWAAKMIPPGETASGFFYFETSFRPGARLYLTGLAEADTGKELFYYEIPLE
ncbi:MAG: hypothetical protein ACE15B_16720 [Bryobacteraceae bacterium]